MTARRSKLLLAAFSTLLVLSVFSLVLAVLAMSTQTQISNSHEDRLQRYQLADELRQSSDDLTRMARLYAVTGDERYRDYFQRILDIRHGEAPRPARYSDIYWDFVTDSHRYPPDRAGAESVALRELMEQAGFTSDELALLEQAEDNSDALAEIETAAMQESPEVLSAALEIQSDAVKDLHGADYNRIKAQIMQPIDEMHISLSSRMTADIQQKTDQQDVIFPLLLALLSLTILLSTAALVRVVMVRKASQAQTESE